jgi:F5/8 type C domain
MGDDRNQFDDLFEPFELPDSPSVDPVIGATAEPPANTPAPASVESGHVSQNHVTSEHAAVDSISCPACGAQNPAFNHHCERCGSRLNSDPMPIASAPAGRSSAGGRALGVLAAVVLVVALVALMINIFKSGGTDVASTDDSSSTSSSTTQPVIVTELTPSQVTASSQLSDQFSPENLIDGDPETRWNDKSLRGVDAWLEFKFATPVQISEIEFQNVTDDTKFQQNYKVQGYTITVNDLNVPISGRLINSNEPQRVKIASVDTITLRVAVSTTYPAEPVGDAPPFDELALEGIRFFGVEK